MHSKITNKNCCKQGCLFANTHKICTRLRFRPECISTISEWFSRLVDWKIFFKKAKWVSCKYSWVLTFHVWHLCKSWRLPTIEQIALWKLEMWVCGDAWNRDDQGFLYWLNWFIGKTNCSPGDPRSVPRLSQNTKELQRLTLVWSIWQADA